MEEKPVRLKKKPVCCFESKKSQFVGGKSQLVVLNQVVNYACCSLAVIFCSFISLLIGREQ